MIQALTLFRAAVAQRLRKQNKSTLLISPYAFSGPRNSVYIFIQFKTWVVIWLPKSLWHAMKITNTDSQRIENQVGVSVCLFGEMRSRDCNENDFYKSQVSYNKDFRNWQEKYECSVQSFPHQKYLTVTWLTIKTFQSTLSFL